MRLLTVRDLVDHDTFRNVTGYCSYEYNGSKIYHVSGFGKSLINNSHFTFYTIFIFTCILVYTL